MLQSKKSRENKETDNADLFCKLLAKEFKDFPKDEKEKIMYEIHGLILKNAAAQYFTFYLQSQLISNSSNELLPRNTVSPDSPNIQHPYLYSHTSPSQIIMNRLFTSHSSYSYRHHNKTSMKKEHIRHHLLINNLPYTVILLHIITLLYYHENEEKINL